MVVGSGIPHRYFKLQGKDHLISDTVSAIFAFQGKLRLSKLQLEGGSIVHFPSCQKLFPTGENRKTLAATYAPQVEYLLSEFQQRFKAFESKKSNYDLFRDPFSVAPEDTAPTLQLELIDLQCSPELKSMHRESQLLDFYRSLDRSKYGNLVDHALKLASLFGSTYVCEQTFSLMTLNKNRLRSSTTDMTLRDVLKTATSAMTPDFENLSAAKRTRGVVRSAVSRTLAQIDALLENPDSTEVQLRIPLEYLTQKQAALKDLDSDILAAITDDALEDEVEGAEEYRLRISTSLTRLHYTLDTFATNPQPRLPEAPPVNPPSTATIVRSHRTVALPKLQVPMFAGNLRDWQGFWDHFNVTIHANPDLPPIEKFKFLMTYLTDHAKRAVEGIRLSDQNYELAV
ncbi:hypothetical protein ISCGN_007366 [Ixodes scapularis]